MSTSRTNTNAQWLTQEAYDRLQAELNYLCTEGRSTIIKKIEEARQEGDLKENGGYHAAKEEQGKTEARIAQLTALLENTRVGDAPADNGIIKPGMVVTAEIGAEAATFLLGSREVTVTDDLDVFSKKSPLGQAINGLKIGDKTSYKTPNGKDISVTILHVKPYRG